MVELSKEQEWFLERTIPEPNSGCLLWTAAMVTMGYGNVKFRGQIQGAHRAAWKLFRGPIPKGLFVCHRCDTRLCVNVDHLFLGTPRDNVRDMMSKRRDIFCGERNRASKLTENAVHEILKLRDTGLSTYKIAAIFQVAPATIGKVVRGEAWKTVSR